MLKVQWFMVKYVPSNFAYYGTITPLSVARHTLVTTTVGNYALFGGGFPISNVVDAYYVF